MIRDIMSRAERRFLLIITLICIASVFWVIQDMPYSSNKSSKLSKYYDLRRLSQYEDTEVIGWETHVVRDVKKYLDPSKDTTILPGLKICNSNTSTAIIVTTTPSSVLRRSSIRETWASHDISSVKVGFFVGLANEVTQNVLVRESTKYEDIVQENVVDSYNNLTLKSVGLLKWFLRSCPSAKILVKTDDDAFVDVKLLTKRLAYYHPHGLLRGVLFANSTVVRNLSSKWYVPKYMYSNPTYPQFLSGSSYFMSRDVAKKLYATALETPIFHLEDVFVTGFCARKAGVKPRRFSDLQLFQRESLECRMNHVICHRVNPQQMRFLWKKRKGKT